MVSVGQPHETGADFDDLPRTFELTPQENLGHRGGYVPMMTEIRIIDDPSPDELGEAPLTALDIATD